MRPCRLQQGVCSDQRTCAILKVAMHITCDAGARQTPSTRMETHARTQLHSAGSPIAEARKRSRANSESDRSENPEGQCGGIIRFAHTKMRTKKGMERDRTANTASNLRPRVMGLGLSHRAKVAVIFHAAWRELGTLGHSRRPRRPPKQNTPEPTSIKQTSRQRHSLHRIPKAVAGRGCLQRCWLCLG